MGATEYRIGFIFLFSLVFVAFLIFAWFSYQEMMRRRYYFGKLRYLVPHAIGIVVFLAGAIYVAYAFWGWAGRGFAVVLP